jgi:hypothetical protein
MVITGLAEVGHTDTSIYVKLWYKAVYLRINYVG